MDTLLTKTRHSVFSLNTEQNLCRIGNSDLDLLEKYLFGFEIVSLRLAGLFFFWFLTLSCYSLTVLPWSRAGSKSKKVLSGMVVVLSVAYSLWTVNWYYELTLFSSWHITSGKWAAPAVAVVEHLKWQCPHVGLPLRPAGAHHLIWEESFFQACIRCFPVANCYPSGVFLKARHVLEPLQSRGLVLLLVPELLSKKSCLDSVKLKLSVSFGLDASSTWKIKCFPCRETSV